MVKESKNSDEDEIVYISIKGESDDENDKLGLICNINNNDTWIIDSGHSYHMIDDKFKFENLVL